MKDIITRALPRINRRVNTVFRCRDIQPEIPPLPLGLQWEVASVELIEQVFPGDKQRSRALLNLLRKGARGIIIHDGQHWAAHGFISPPGVALPGHLPANIVQAYWWFFYMHTCPHWRRKGLQKACINLGIKHKKESGGNLNEVLSDTGVDNLPSRKAFLRTGFEPTGIIRVRGLRLPRLGTYPLYYRWDEEESHGRLS